ncbi:MAG: Type 1 glutamine amidotransferase-like domain-containing protein [Fimbriimonadaceae bacterium]
MGWLAVLAAGWAVAVPSLTPGGLTSASDPGPDRPGLLFAVGGGSTPSAVVRRFLVACGGSDARVLVLPLTRENPAASGPGSVELLEENGAKNARMFAVGNPTPDDLALLASEIAEAKGIWIPGGDQSLLVERLGEPFVRAHLQAAYRRGVHFFGTSAGAMLMSHPMITGNGELPGTATTGPGIGLTPWLIDSHFRERNREPRLRHAMAALGNPRAIGLSERSWVVLRGPKILERHGDVTVFGQE